MISDCERHTVEDKLSTSGLDRKITAIWRWTRNHSKWLRRRMEETKTITHKSSSWMSIACKKYSIFYHLETYNRWVKHAFACNALPSIILNGTLQEWDQTTHVSILMDLKKFFGVCTFRLDMIWSLLRFNANLWNIYHFFVMWAWIPRIEQFSVWQRFL